MNRDVEEMEADDRYEAEQLHVNRLKGWLVAVQQVYWAAYP